MESRLFTLKDETGVIRVARAVQKTRSIWDVGLPGGIIVDCEGDEVETVVGMYGDDLREWSDETGNFERLADREQLELIEGVA